MLAGCADAPPAATPPPPVVYEAGLAPWPVMPASATIGRGVAPARAAPVTVTAAEAFAPVLPGRIYDVPGADARAAVSGTVGDAIVVELIGVDDGVIRWRDTTACQAPVVHATAGVVVCADATHLVGLAVETGAEVWRHDGVFAGADGALIVAHAGERVLVIEADGGKVVVDEAPPAGVRASEVERACATPGGVELWAWGPAGNVQRFEAGKPEVEVVVIGRAPARAELCAEPALVEIPIPGSSERALSVIARAPLRIAAGPVIERGFWRGAGAEVVTATARGIEVRDAALEVLRRTSDVEVGRELSARGTRRLVRGAGGLPVLLDGDRPIATLSAPAYVDSAVLGDAYVLGGPWQSPARSLADRPQRFRLPDATTAVAPVLVAPPARAPVHALDLPMEGVAGAEITRADAGAHDVGVIFTDPDDPAMIYAATLEGRPDAQHGAGIAALDLRARAWAWHAPEGCAPGTPVAVAVAADVIACGSRSSVAGSGAVRAIARAGGEVRWTWTGVTVDAVVAAGGLVVVTVARRAVVLDAATGAQLAEVRSDDGFVPRLVAARWRGHDAVFAVERGAIVARLPRIGMLPVWSVAVEGSVVALARAGAKLTAELASDELYLLDLDTGSAIAASGWARRWRPVGVDLVAVEDADLEDYRLDGFGLDGAPRFAVSLAIEPPRQLGVRGADGAPVVLAYGPASRAAAVLDPRTGVVARRVTLPERAVPGAVFATVVDGAPVAGAVLARPLGAVLF